MSEWKEIKLKEFVKVSSGEGLPDYKMKPGQYPVYGGNGITGYHNQFKFEESRLIIGRVGALCGNVHITQNRSWITDNALVVSFIDKNQDENFWYFVLNNLNLREYAFQSAQPVITGGIIEKIKIKIPTNGSSQQKIARILTTCDSVIEQTQSAIAKYKAIKQGLLHDLFTRGLDASGRLRPTYHQSPELYKESELGMIPKEWEVKRLEELVEVLVSNVDKKSYDGEKRVSLCNYMDVYQNEYITSEINFMQATASNGQILKFGIKKGDVMITKDSETPDDIGISAVSLEDFDNVVCGYHLALFKPKKDKLIGEFLSKQLSRFEINRFYANRANGSTRYGLTLSVIGSILIPLPSFDEQKRIIPISWSVDQKINAEETLLQKYQSIKRGLMGDLLGGRKEV